MYLIDYHTHSLLSPDSQEPLTAMAQAAVRSGLQELCVTDHYDLLDEQGKRRGPHDWASAVAQYDVVAAQAPNGFRLKLGMELGSAHVEPSHAAELTAHPRADFIIGSLHNWSVEQGGGDYYFTDYSTSGACYAALDDYFCQMEALAPLSDCYDVLGHVIYPLRYMNRDGQFPTLERYHDQLRRILRTAVEHGRGIEVNTYRGRTVAEWQEVLALYKECGGEIVTVGSDAHRAADVAGGVREAYALLADCGFRYVASYTRRKPEFHKL